MTAGLTCSLVANFRKDGGFPDKKYTIDSKDRFFFPNLKFVSATYPASPSSHTPTHTYLTPCTPYPAAQDPSPRSSTRRQTQPAQPRKRAQRREQPVQRRGVQPAGHAERGEVRQTVEDEGEVGERPLEARFEVREVGGCGGGGGRGVGALVICVQVGAVGEDGGG